MARPRGSTILRTVRRHWFALAAGAIVTAGVAYRIALIAVGWPHEDAEEGTMGLEAMHILQRGEHPIYFYGQNYLGVAQAYAGALMFRLGDISAFTLRVGLVAFDTIFLLSLCWLAVQLYSRVIALLSIGALVLAWPFLMRIELLADGAKPEAMAASALMFALATWLALSRPEGKPTGKQRWLRYGAFAAWGLVAGFGVYTYTVVAPFVLASALLLWLTCRRELRGWALVLAGAGLIIGYMPAIVYAISLPSTANPVRVIGHLLLHGSTSRAAYGKSPLHTLVKEVDASIVYALPQITGLVMPYTVQNSVQNIPFYGPFTLGTVITVIVGGTWSVLYLSLLGVATYRPFKAIWATTQWGMARQKNSDAQNYTDAKKWTIADAQSNARDAARLTLVLAAWLTIGAYVASPVSAANPTTGRYLVTLGTALPAVLWPLVEGVQRLLSRREVLLAIGSILILAILGLNLAFGVIAIVGQIPGTVAATQQNRTFAHDLLNHGITRLYSDYWTCDLVTFIDHEGVICSVLSPGQLPPGQSRYTAYDTKVAADSLAPIVLVHDSINETKFMASATARHLQFSEQHLDGYDVFTPLQPLLH